MSEHHWKEKTAVVCGATSGLGREIAMLLADVGVAKLIILARNEGQLQAFKSSLSIRCPEVEVAAFSVDVCSREQVQALVEQVTETLGVPQLVVQAVGASDRGTIAELGPEHLRSLIDVNVMSSLNVIQAFRPALQQSHGHIVLIGSLASLFAPRFLGGYAIAKHALAALAQQSRLELAEDGIKLLLACPGPIARDDAGSRYTHHPSSGESSRGISGEGLPAEALQPGGGAKVGRLDPRALARDILAAAAAGKTVIIRPRKARLLLIVAAFFPRLADRLLRKKTS